MWSQKARVTSGIGFWPSSAESLSWLSLPKGSEKKNSIHIWRVDSLETHWLRGELGTDPWQKGTQGSLRAMCNGRRAARWGWAMGCPSHSSRQCCWSRAHWQHMIRLQRTPQDRCITHPWLNGRQQAQKCTSQAHTWAVFSYSPRLRIYSLIRSFVKNYCYFEEINSLKTFRAVMKIIWNH